MRRATVLLAALALLLMTAAPASANNDPHRSYVPVGSGMVSGLCSFAFDYANVDKEYQTVSTSDGSTIVKTTGSNFSVVTNDITGKSITLNLSGPGTLVIPATGTVWTADVRGLASTGFANLTTFGFPSNEVVTSGEFEYSFDVNTGLMVSVIRMPHVFMDVCAALS